MLKCPAQPSITKRRTRAPGKVKGHQLIASVPWIKKAYKNPTQVYTCCLTEVHSNFSHLFKS